MAFKLPESVQETTTTTGTGTLTLDGAVPNRFAFSSQLVNNDTVFYVVDNGTDLEVGVGTFTNTSGDQLSRDTVLYSTNGNAKVSWAAGTRNVFAGLPGAVIASLLDPGAANGLLAQTAARSYARRVIQAGANIQITNPDGVNGNPLIAVTGTVPDADTVDGKHAAEFLWDTDLGSSVQAWADALDEIAALSRADGNIIVGDGTSWVAESGLTARQSLGIKNTDQSDTFFYSGTGTFTVNHPLGAVPIITGFRFTNNTADGGYSPGDTTFPLSILGTLSVQSATTTQITFTIGQALQMANKGGTGNFTLGTSFNWSINAILTEL